MASSFDQPSPGNPPTTQWSLIDRARQAPVEERRPAVEELVRRYLPAIRAHLLHSMRLDTETVEEVAQGFVVDRLLEGRLTTAADPGKGRFRSLLVRALENYAIDMLRRRRREGSSERLATDGYHNEIATDPAKGDAFDAAWAREVLVRSLQAMRAECQGQLCEPRWRLFERRVLRPLLEDETAPTYEVLLEEFQFTTPQQASNALVSAKRHFQRVLTQVVGEYSADDAEICDELVDLRAIVSGAGPIGLRLALLDEDSVDSAPGAISCSGELLAVLCDDDRADSPWNIDDFPGLWLHQLAQPLDSVLTPAGPGAARKLVEKTITVAALLQNERPAVGDLRRLKETARACVRAGRPDVPNEIATALYFAAIAAAIARCGQRITKSDDSVLEHGLRMLLTRAWLDDQTRHLLQSVWSELATD